MLLFYYYYKLKKSLNYTPLEEDCFRVDYSWGMSSAVEESMSQYISNLEETRFLDVTTIKSKEMQKSTESMLDK